MQGLSAGCIYVGSSDPVRVLTSVTQRICWILFEAFITETYVQLVATEATCYSTGMILLSLESVNE